MFLAIAFLSMAWRTYKLRQIMVPKAIKEADDAGLFQGADVTKLKPIFNHMLTIELIAFLLTAFAAIVDFFILSV